MIFFHVLNPLLGLEPGRDVHRSLAIFPILLTIVIMMTNNIQMFHGLCLPFAEINDKIRAFHHVRIMFNHQDRDRFILQNRPNTIDELI
ncbi:hypothetical protein D3C85_1042960 [compost metagenome]